MFLDPDLSTDKSELSLLRSAMKLFCAVSVLTLLIMMIYYLIPADKASPQLAALVAENIADSGVKNPVTAVLLNFRSYDTLLEVAVLVIVAAAMLPTISKESSPGLLTVNRELFLDPAFEGLLRWLVPLAIIVGGYLLWTGAYAPGGAFHAGAMMAAAGVALSLAERYTFNWQSSGAHLLLAIGLAVFVLVGGVSVFFTGTYLEYPQAYAGLLILLIEVAATVSIAAILLLLFTSIQSSTPAGTAALAHSPLSATKGTRVKQA